MRLRPTPANLKRLEAWHRKLNRYLESSFRVEVAGTTGRPFRGTLAKRLTAAKTYLKAPLRYLEVVLIGDRRMSHIHEEFMGIAGPTDVMTFPLELDDKGRPLHGEVYVCVPEARRRALERGHTVSKEVLLYALHGMLHLCGYDDRTDRDFATMHRREDEILNQLGVGPVFARTPARPAASRRPPRRSGARA